jgi:viologen exporter family transport system permease protein
VERSVGHEQETATLVPRTPVSGLPLARVVAAMVSINLRSRMEYRVDFAIWILFGVVYHVAALAFVWVVVAQFRGLGDWSLEQVLFLIGLRLVAHAVFETIFGNLDVVGEMVRTGTFDRMLIRPISPLLQVLLAEFRVNGLGDFVIGLAIFLLVQPTLNVAWTPLALGYLLLVIAGSVLLEAGIFLTIASLTFWIIHSESLVWWAGDLVNTFGNYPLSIFPQGARYLFTFVFPIAFLAFFPAAVFLGRAGDVPFTPLFAYGAPVIGLAVFAVGRVVWQVGLGHHQSTGT